MANKKRFTFFTDDYPAVTCDSCYEDQNEYYTGPAIDRLAEYEATGLMPAEVAALTQELKHAKQQCREERRWIPVTERLPEINDKARDWSVTVLFRTIQGYIHSGYRNVGSLPQSYYDDDFTPPYWLDESENLDFDEDEVTHWMPLPDPPKEETP